MEPDPAQPPVFDPCRRRFEDDLLGADVAAGLAAGLWRITGYAWPHVQVAFTAGDGNEFGMRLLVDGYPALAPAGQPWDLKANTLLPVDRWPVGGTAPQIFRKDWSVANSYAPYMACDRIALNGHPWATANPDRAWNPTRTLAFYLQQVHHELRAATIPAAQ